MQSKSPTVEHYLASLPDDRRAAIKAVRDVILANLDRGPDGKSGFTELMQYGMIGYAVPHSIFPPGYHCDPKQPLPFGGLASQKQHMSLYLMCLYGHAQTESEFRKQWAKSGKKLDMGKACIRFKKVDDLALDVIAATIKRVTAKKYVDFYIQSLAAQGKDPSGKKISAAKKAPASKRATQSPAAKPSASKKTTRKAASRAKK